MIKYLNNPNRFVCLSTDLKTKIAQNGNIVLYYDTGLEYIYLGGTWYLFDNAS
jgi:hypothetical protein